MLVLVAYLLRTRLREPHGRHARRAGGRTRGADPSARARSCAGSCCSRASARSFFGLTPFATQPIRAAHFPAINEGEPTACRTKLEFVVHVLARARTTRSCTTSTAASTASRDLSERQAPFARADRDVVAVLQVAVAARRARRASVRCRRCSPRSFLVLGLFGGWVHCQRDRRSFWYFGSLMFTMTLVLIYYLNFKYGASQEPELAGVPREVRDRDYFYPLELLGVGRVGRARPRRTSGSRSPRCSARRRVKLGRETVDAADAARAGRSASPLLALALDAAVRQLEVGVARRTDATRATSRATCSTPSSRTACSSPSATTTPSRSGTRRKSRASARTSIVANTSLLNTDWYVRQLIRRPVYEYDAAKGPAIYRGKQWTKPTAPPIHMTMARGRLGAGVLSSSNAPMNFSAGTIKATIDPQRLSITACSSAPTSSCCSMIADVVAGAPDLLQPHVGRLRQRARARRATCSRRASRRSCSSRPPSTAAGHGLRAGRRLARPAAHEALWDSVFTGPKSLHQAATGSTARRSAFRISTSRRA